MLFILFLFLSISAFSQIKVIQKDAKTLVIAANPKKAAKPTEWTFVDKDGKSYPVYATEKGRYYVNKISKKTGKSYKAYITFSTK